MYRWTDRKKDGQRGRQMDKWTDRKIAIQTYGHAARYTDEQP